VFVGEAPGREEDIQGLPFVGRAGELLTKIIEAMGLKRKDVYISNVLKCRPPQNRNPLPSEVAACQDYLRQQLEIISPRVICCLGKFSCLLLLNQDAPISRLRGQFQDFRGIKVMPTFHPAYLLRNPAAKRLVWEDMQKIMTELRRT
ncbi:uracil-DNA glycosylase, partial [bacterium]|nr:uracil-DNA glycosylase [bacterium]